MAIVSFIVFTFIACVSNASIPLPINPNLAPNVTNPMDGFQAQFDISTQPVPLIARLNEVPKAPQQSDKDLVNRLLINYGLSLHQEPFTESNLSEITAIRSSIKYSHQYTHLLARIIAVSLSRITMWNPRHLNYAQIGIGNFHQFMNALHIKPMTIDEVNNDQFMELDSVLQLLIMSSRSIIHSFAFTDLFDRTEESYYSFIDKPSKALYPWLNHQTDSDCVLDVMKIIYWHSYDFLSSQIGSKLPPLDDISSADLQSRQYLDELTKKWGFIVWPRKVVKTMSTVRDFEQFSKCYAIESGRIFEGFFDDQEMSQLAEGFIAGFHIKEDYQVIMKSVCDEQDRQKS